MSADELRRLLAEQAEDLAAAQALLARLAARQQALLAALAAGERTASAATTSPAAAPSLPAVVAGAPQSPAPTPATTEPPTVREAIEALCQHLEVCDRRCRAQAPGLDPVDIAFLSKARAVLTQPEADIAARALDILAFVDRLSGQLVAGDWQELLRDLAQARALVQPLVPRHRLLQIDSPSPEAACRCLPVREPVIIATGIIGPDGQRLQAPAAIVPDRQPEPLLAAAWALVEELGALLRQPFRKGLKEDLAFAVGEAQRLLAPEADGAAVLRAVLNAHTRWTETIDTPAARRALDLLRARQQWRAYAIAVGERYDPDRHDLKRYDRIGRSSAQPTGTVIGVRQVGLADVNGLPVQKCLVVVSA